MSTTTISVQPFDRTVKEPPQYLGTLRCRGRWRNIELMSRLRYTHDTTDDYLYRTRSTAYQELYGALGYGVKHGSVFLDAGCGDSPDALIARLDGFSSAYKVDLFKPGESFFGRYERELQAEEHRQHVKFIQGDLCEPLDFADQTLDAISCSAVVDLMSEDDRVLFYKQAYRLLKTGGLLSVSIVHLKHGHGAEVITDRDICTMPGWGVNFELERNYNTGFIVRRPELPNQTSIYT